MFTIGSSAQRFFQLWFYTKGQRCGLGSGHSPPVKQITVNPL